MTTPAVPHRLHELRAATSRADVRPVICAWCDHVDDPAAGLPCPCTAYLIARYLPALASS